MATTSLPAHPSEAIASSGQTHSSSDVVARPPHSSVLLTRGDAHTQAALSACARSEASLGALLRSVQQLAAHVTSAQTAKDEIAQEVEHLRWLLGYADEQQLSLREHNAELEAAVARTAAEAERERAFLIEQQDAFIANLMEEHEVALAALRTRLSAAETDLLRYSEDRRAHVSTVRSATATTFELTHKLGAAENALKRVERERDRLRSEAELKDKENQELREELERLRQAPASSSRAPDSVGVPLAAIRLESRQSGLRPEDLGIRTQPNMIAPPAAAFPSSTYASVAVPGSMRQSSVGQSSVGQSSADTNPDSSSGPSSVKPPLKSKPDASTRPLVGYSLVGHDLREELVDSVRERPPTR